MTLLKRAGKCDPQKKKLSIDFSFLLVRVTPQAVNTAELLGCTYVGTK
jgi:hypothetical protein